MLCAWCGCELTEPSVYCESCDEALARTEELLSSERQNSESHDGYDESSIHSDLDAQVNDLDTNGERRKFLYEVL